MIISREIKLIIVEELGVNSKKVVPEASFAGDLGADSLDIVELIIALEEKFNIKISDEDAEKMETVDDVIKYIEKRKLK